MPLRRIVTVFTLIAVLMVPGTVAARPAIHVTPIPTPEAIDCAGLDDYMEDVYHGTEPEVSMTELGIVRAAWRGPYNALTLAEVSIAQYFSQEWARALADVPDDQIPAGLDDLHALYLRRVELMNASLTAHMGRDVDAYDEAIDELWEVSEALYVIGLAGVDQCGDHWLDAFGEPWDPTPDATPAASPAP